MTGGTRMIAVVTGTRAEFGLLVPVMRAIAARRELRLRTVVTGTHLITESIRDVEAEFRIDAKVPMQREGEERTRHADAMAVARGIGGMAQAFATLAPDVVLVLGDRIEAFAAASAASIAGYRVAHVHGGDRAEGVADEAMRHAITKLAHLHFAATEGSRVRIVRMGEDERFVWNVGSPAVDAIAAFSGSTEGARGSETARAGDASPRAAALHPLNGAQILVMQHPIGAGDAQERAWAAATLRALGPAAAVVMAPNHDAGREGVLAGLLDAGYGVVEHLPRPEFLALLRGARAIVGNSSAGLIEAAALRVPCVNVGPRQAGRERGANVVDCDYGEASVRAALGKALALDLTNVTHPYGDGRSGERIAEILATIELPGVRKRNSY